MMGEGEKGMEGRKDEWSEGGKGKGGKGEGRKDLMVTGLVLSRCGDTYRGSQDGS